MNRDKQILLILIAMIIAIICIYKIKIEKEKYDYKVKVYCINLQRRPDRKDSFLSKIKDSIYYSMLDIEIVDAVDRDNIDKDVFEGVLNTTGEIGCYLSHINCFLRLLSTPKTTNFCMIYEDDALCKDTLKEILDTEPTKKYDLLILGSNYRKGDNITCVDDDEIKQKICTNLEYVFGAHAYLINKKAANILLKNSIPIRKPFDLYYSNSKEFKDLKIGFLNTSVCSPVNLLDSDSVKN